MADQQLRRRLAVRALATAERYKIDLIADRWDKLMATPSLPPDTVLQNSGK
jgi:hypothetical protein